MFENPYENSLEPRLLSATPLERVVMLYDGALSSVRNARAALAGGRIAERSHAIAKAVEILAELARSLDHSAGGELSRNLAALYDYMQRILLEANFRQADHGLAETERLLSTLREAWAQAARMLAGPAPEAHPIEAVGAELPWSAAAQEPMASHQWSA